MFQGTSMDSLGTSHILTRTLSRARNQWLDLSWQRLLATLLCGFLIRRYLWINFRELTMRQGGRWLPGIFFVGFADSRVLWVELLWIPWKTTQLQILGFWSQGKWTPTVLTSMVSEVWQFWQQLGSSLQLHLDLTENLRSSSIIWTPHGFRLVGMSKFDVWCFGSFLVGFTWLYNGFRWSSQYLCQGWWTPETPNKVNATAANMPGFLVMSEIRSPHKNLPSGLVGVDIFFTISGFVSWPAVGIARSCCQVLPGGFSSKNIKKLIFSMRSWRLPSGVILKRSRACAPFAATSSPAGPSVTRLEVGWVRSGLLSMFLGETWRNNKKHKVWKVHWASFFFIEFLYRRVIYRCYRNWANKSDAAFFGKGLLPTALLVICSTALALALVAPQWDPRTETWLTTSLGALAWNVDVETWQWNVHGFLLLWCVLIPHFFEAGCCRKSNFRGKLISWNDLRKRTWKKQFRFFRRPDIIWIKDHQRLRPRNGSCWSASLARGVLRRFVGATSCGLVQVCQCQ